MKVKRYLEFELCSRAMQMSRPDGSQKLKSEDRSNPQHSILLEEYNTSNTRFPQHSSAQLLPGFCLRVDSGSNGFQQVSNNLVRTSEHKGTREPSRPEFGTLLSPVGITWSSLYDTLSLW